RPVPRWCRRARSRPWAVVTLAATAGAKKGLGLGAFRQQRDRGHEPRIPDRAPRRARDGVSVKALPPAAEVAQVALAGPRLEQARPRALAPAELQISAASALARQLVVLVEAELELSQRKHELRERALTDAPELVLGIHEVIARVDPPVVLERDVF